MNAMQKKLRPGRSVAVLPNGMPLHGDNYASGSRLSLTHWRRVAIVWCLLMLLGCSTPQPVVPDCPKPPDPVPPPVHLTVPLPTPYRHADVAATSGAQLQVCARNYQEVMRPALDRLRDWQEWAR